MEFKCEVCGSLVIVSLGQIEVTCQNCLSVYRKGLNPNPGTVIHLESSVERSFEVMIAPLTVTVLKDGVPVEGANVIVISKKIPTLFEPIPSYYVSRTDREGKVYFYIPEGYYLVFTDDGTDFRAYKDDVEVPTSITLDLVEKKEARYFVKLILTVDVAPWIAPIIDALARVTDKFIEIATWITAPLDIVIPGEELARHFEIEKVEGVGKEVTIWIRYVGGSPVPQAVIMGIIVLACLILLIIVAPIMAKWVFGEEVVPVIKWWAIALAAIGAGVALTAVVRMVKK